MTNNFTRQNIIRYGQANGYSPKEISEALNKAKSQIVDYGINAGYKGSEINQALNNAGHGNYNPLLTRTNWEQALPNLAKGAKEFARDMTTMGGTVLQPFIDVAKTPQGQKMEAAKKRFSEAINNEALRRTAMGAATGATIGSKLGGIGLIGGTFTGGLIGLMGPQGLANAYLQTYDTSLEDIGKVKRGEKSLGDLATDIMQGGIRNPFYSGIDLLFAGGAKALGQAGRAVGRAIPKSAPMFIQELLPSPETREFNRAATNAIQYAKAKNADLIQPLEQLKSTLGTNDAELARYIITNESKLTGKELDLAKDLKKAIKLGESRAIEYGLLDKADSKTNVVAQYGMNKLRDLVPDIIHDDVVKYIEKGELSPRMAEATLRNPDLKTYIDEVISKGNDLYDKDYIGFLTQELIGQTDPRGEVLARASAKVAPGYFGTKRIIGRARPEDYAIENKLADSIEFQQRQIGDITGAIDTLETLLLQPGMKRVLDTTSDIPKGYTVINPNEFRANMATAFQAGGNVDINKVLKQSDLAEKGAYLIPNVYFRALENMFAPRGKSTGMLASFKKTVLANPHWFGLNRIGNWTGNSMGGVKFFEDYNDANKYMNIMPKQLVNQTSFNAYIGNDGMFKFSESFTRPVKDFMSEAKRFAASEKGIKDINRIIGSFVANTGNIASNPIYRLEAMAERMDRYANYIRQAKRYAKENKIKDWKEVVKKSDTDYELFNKLNNQVNKDLGDYVGRNYLIPNEKYELINNLVPFYRFLTQTGRTTFHQLANHPLSFQATVMAPARAGKQISEDIIRQYQLDPESYEGGVPYVQQPDGTWRFIGTEALPAGAVAKDLLSGSNPASLISPMYSMVQNVLGYKKGEGWLPTSPGLTQYKMAKGTTKGYEPTLGERVGYGVSQFANTFYAPVRMSRGWMREAFNTATGAPTFSNYDTNILQTNPLSYGRSLPSETIGKWVGIQTRPYYPKYIEKPKKPTKRQMAKAAMYRQQYEQNTKEVNK